MMNILRKIFGTQKPVTPEHLWLLLTQCAPKDSFYISMPNDSNAKHYNVLLMLGMVYRCRSDSGNSGVCRTSLGDKEVKRIQAFMRNRESA